MKVYHIRRVDVPFLEGIPQGVHCAVEDTLTKEIFPLVEVDGDMEYGYGGSGPHALAWSILCCHLGESNMSKREKECGELLSFKLHQKYTEEITSQLDMKIDSHVIYEIEIIMWIKKHYPDFDLPTYMEKRESFRVASRQVNQYEGMDMTNEEYELIKEEWDRAWKIEEEYLNWLRTF